MHPLKTVSLREQAPQALQTGCDRCRRKLDRRCRRCCCCAHSRQPRRRHAETQSGAFSLYERRKQALHVRSRTSQVEISTSMACGELFFRKDLKPSISKGAAMVPTRTSIHVLILWSPMLLDRRRRSQYSRWSGCTCWTGWARQSLPRCLWGRGMGQVVGEYCCRPLGGWVGAHAGLSAAAGGGMAHLRTVFQSAHTEQYSWRRIGSGHHTAQNLGRKQQERGADVGFESAGGTGQRRLHSAGAPALASRRSMTQSLPFAKASSSMHRGRGYPPPPPTHTPSPPTHMRILPPLQRSWTHQPGRTS